jgi:ATP-binding cassette subfamily B protein IrtA
MEQTKNIDIQHMEQSKKNLINEVKGKSRLSNVFIALNVVSGIIPFFIVVWLVGMLMDGTITLDKIIVAGVIIAISQIMKAVFYALSIWKAHDSAYSSLADVRVNLLEHLKKLPQSFFQERKAGDLTNIINHDVEQAELYLAHVLPEVTAIKFILIVVALSVIIIDWRMGLALISTVPLVLLYLSFLNKIWAKQMKIYFEKTKQMSEDMVEYISTIPVIKAFSREEKKTQNVLEKMKSYIFWAKKITISTSTPMSLITLFLEGGLIVLVIVGSILLINHQIDIQRFILALILGGIFSSSLAKMATYQHFESVFQNSMDNVNSIIGAPGEKRPEKYQNLETGDIEFKNVNFSYDEDETVLKNINLVFKENSVNAIVGASGSGKTTIAHLIMGFWKVDSGEITINGRNIDSMSEQDLSSLVSIVQQEVFLFNLSIEENLRIGKKDASREEIIEAAKKAQIHDTIMNLPQDYQTVVGESGTKLSGGEKQRISIARTILKDAPIIILDEATAAIDPNKEYLIQKAINNLSKDKTLIMIAHHLSNIVNTDQIMVMEDGNLIAKGTHQELLETCKLYQKMVKEQTKVDNWKIKEVV